MHRGFEHPLGEGLIHEIREVLTRSSDIAEAENWRDVGWSLTFSTARGEVQIVLAATGDAAWMLQVAPVRVPSVLDRMLRRPVSDLWLEILKLSRTIDAALKASGRYSRLMWRADGPPNEAHWSPEPIDES